MHNLAFYVFPGFQLLDLTGPLSVFHWAGRFRPEQAYGISVTSRHGGTIASSAGLTAETTVAADARPDTVMVVGGRGVDDPERAEEPQTATVRKLAQGAQRVTSVCTGAFLLARAGRLDGRHATTHWRHAPELRRQFPRVTVDGERLFVRDGEIWTSAGITAGIDLALALVEEDLGLATSQAVARELVVYQRRPGGQSQFSEMLELEPRAGRIRRVLDFIRTHLAEPLPVVRLADVACLGPRQFSRLFHLETGETPSRAVERLRAEAARPRIEARIEPVEAIAASVGFKDPERMRRAFLRRFGRSPQAVRREAPSRPTQTRPV